VSADTELRRIADSGPLGAEGELHKLIVEYGERLHG
jgi:hypothetical protein